MDTELPDAPNLVIVERQAASGGYVGSALYLAPVYKQLRRYGQNIDAFYCITPRPFCWLPRMMFPDKRFLYHMVGDPFTFQETDSYSQIKRATLSIGYMPEWWLTKWALEREPFIVNGHTVFERYRHLNPAQAEAVVSTTLTEEDFYPREDTCQGPEVRLLYVGFLRPAKGIEYLLEAVAALRKEGMAVSLDIAGDGDSRQALTTYTQELGIDSAVRFLGHVAFGDSLRDVYRSADIFVFPSLAEGSPRVVLEAAARGLPIIATEVGSIPYVFHDGADALLVPTRNSQALADAICKMIKDDQLRRCCIRQGFEIARKHTVEGFIADLINRLITDKEAN